MKQSIEKSDDSNLAFIGSGLVNEDDHAKNIRSGSSHFVSSGLANLNAQTTKDITTKQSALNHAASDRLAMLNTLPWCRTRSA